MLNLRDINWEVLVSILMFCIFFKNDNVVDEIKGIYHFLLLKYIWNTWFEFLLQYLELSSATVYFYVEDSKGSNINIKLNEFPKITEFFNFKAGIHYRRI